MRGLSAGYGAAATSVVPSHSDRTSYARHPTVAVTRAPTGQPDLRATQSRLVVIAQAACTSIQLLCIAYLDRIAPLGDTSDLPPRCAFLPQRGDGPRPRCPAAVAPAAGSLRRRAAAAARRGARAVRDGTGDGRHFGARDTRSPPWRRRERTCAPRGCFWVHTHASGAESAPEAQTLRQGYARPMNGPCRSSRALRLRVLTPQPFRPDPRSGSNAPP